MIFICWLKAQRVGFKFSNKMGTVLKIFPMVVRRHEFGDGWGFYPLPKITSVIWSPGGVHGVILSTGDPIWACPKITCFFGAASRAYNNELQRVILLHIARRNEADRIDESLLQNFKLFWDRPLAAKKISWWDKNR